MEFQKRRLYSDSEKDANATKSKLKSLINKANKTLDLYQTSTPLSIMKYDDLTDILYRFEKASSIVRSVLNDRYLKNKSLLILKTNNEKKRDMFGVIVDDKELLNDDEFNEEINTKISVEFDNKLFHLHTPLTLKRGYVKENFRQNYMIANAVENALIDWQNQHEKSLWNSLNIPFIIVVKRVQNSFSINKICDNDNIENQRIINAITKAFNLPDNARCMSVYDTFSITDNEKEVGTHFYIFEESELEKHLNLLKSNV